MYLFQVLIVITRLLFLRVKGFWGHAMVRSWTHAPNGPWVGEKASDVVGSDDSESRKKAPYPDGLRETGHLLIDGYWPGWMLRCGEFSQVEFSLFLKRIVWCKSARNPGSSQSLKVNPVLHDARQDKTKYQKNKQQMLSCRDLGGKAISSSARKSSSLRGQKSLYGCSVLGSCQRGREDSEGHRRWADLASIERAGAEPGTQILIPPLVRHLLLTDVPTLQRGPFCMQTRGKGLLLKVGRMGLASPLCLLLSISLVTPHFPLVSQARYIPGMVLAAARAATDLGFTIQRATLCWEERQNKRWQHSALQYYWSHDWCGTLKMESLIPGEEF